MTLTLLGLADRFMTREEAAKNGKLYAKEIGCYDDSRYFYILGELFK